MTEHRYRVLEKLRGTAEYEITATSKKDAIRKLREGDHGDMLDSQVLHTGVASDINRIADDE